MANEHTPGPWTVERAIFDEATGDVAYILEGVKTTNVSDARLIAAAPDLLEALEGMLNEHGCIDDCGKASSTYRMGAGARRYRPR